MSESSGRRLPHRARLHGRGPGARRRPSGRPRPSGPSRTSRSRARPSSASLISALAAIKGAAARRERSAQDDRQARWPTPSTQAAEEVAAGQWDEEFPVDVFQTGSGTSTNMNMNEVLATLASERLGRQGASQRRRQRLAVLQRRVPLRHPPGRGHRRSQDDLIPALEHLAEALRKKSREFSDVVKSGRTHLMDATPVTLGQEFGGYAAAVEHGIERLQVGPAPGRRAAARRDRRRDRASTPRRVRPAGDRSAWPRATGLPLTRGPRPLRGPGRPRRARGGVGRAAHDRGVALQDRQRPALDGQRAPLRAGRDPHPRPAARLVDHARQGQPGRPRGRLPGRGPGDRQRRRRGLRRRRRQLRAQRDAAGDRPQPARVDPAAGRR